MTREPDAIQALRSYARDIERSVDALTVQPVDEARQDSAATPVTDSIALRFTSLAVSAAVLASLVIGVVAVRDGAVTPSTPPESSANVSEVVPAVNAVRAVAQLQSLGLAEAATAVERADNAGAMGSEEGVSLLSTLMGAVDAWLLDPVGDLANDPVLVAAVDGLIEISRPPGLDPGFVPPGQDDGSLPPGQDEDFVPPGQDEDFVPPGQDESDGPGNGRGRP